MQYFCITIQGELFDRQGYTNQKAADHDAGINLLQLSCNISDFARAFYLCCLRLILSLYFCSQAEICCKNIKFNNFILSN